MEKGKKEIRKLCCRAFTWRGVSARAEEMKPGFMSPTAGERGELGTGGEVVT